MEPSERPIGVFDSGVGGLTVVQAIRRRLPAERIVYLGDTARVPYGTKSADSVERYAAQAAAHLRRHDVKLLVLACNTATTVAVEPLAASLAPLPVIGVIGPGAEAAVAASARQHHLVLATEGTVARKAYTHAIQEREPMALVEERPCSLFVALAEEGWTRGAIAEAVAREYLEPVLARPLPRQPDSVILGCTHFPLLREPLQAVLGERVSLVDSATTTAEAVAHALEGQRMTRRGPERGALALVATDDRERFARVGSAFLGEPVRADDVELADL